MPAPEVRYIVNDTSFFPMLQEEISYVSPAASVARAAWTWNIACLVRLPEAALSGFLYGGGTRFAGRCAKKLCQRLRKGNTLAMFLP